MNVVISSYVHWWNAEAAYAAVLAELLQADGHRVWVLTRRGTYNGAQLRARGLDTLTDIPLWEARPLRLRAAMRAMAEFQARERVQIVDVFRSRETPWHLLAARGQPDVTVVRTRGSARRIRGHWLNRRLYRDGCDGLIASSEVVRAQMVRALRLPPERVRTIYYPVDLPPLPTPEQRSAERQALLAELGLPEDAFLLAIVGRAAPEKGHDRLLEAFGGLIQRHPHLVLLVLDKRFDDPPAFREKLQRRELKLGLEQNVRWLGFRDDVRRVMALVDIGVIPSLASEVNCRVAEEFFSVAVPVVAFPTGALPEVVLDGVSGRVTRSHQPQALAEALEPLIADGALRETLGAGGRREAERRFSKSRFLAETLAAFEEARARRRNQG